MQSTALLRALVFIAAGCSAACTVLFQDASPAVTVAPVGDAPPPPRYVFMTSDLKTAGALQGTAGADTFCQTSADAARNPKDTNLPSVLKSKHFVALISDAKHDPFHSEANPTGKIERSADGWAIPTGERITSSENPWPGFGNSTFGSNKLNVNQNGSVIEPDALTKEVRFWRDELSGQCQRWTSSDENASGVFMTQNGGRGHVTCQATLHVLCVEVP